MTLGLPDFFRYNLWANRILLDFCSQLTDEQLDIKMIGTYGSVRETITHYITSEEGYAHRFTYMSEVPNPMLKDMPTFPGFDELRQHAERSGNELIAIAEQADLDQILHLDDGTYDAAVFIVLLQAINHGIDHRSQIATMLSQQGIELPSLDAWSYNDFLRS